MTLLPSRLLVVTDRTLSTRSVLDTIAAALRGGATWFWLRDRDMDRVERERLARELMDLLSGRAFLTLGGDVELAWKLGAQGAHISMRADVRAARDLLGPGALIGVSAHSRDEAAKARRDGADYVTLSPIFPSDSKPGYGPPLGLRSLAPAPRMPPVLALGGVRITNAAACIHAGASGVAVMGGVSGGGDPEAATAALLHAIQNSDLRGTIKGRTPAASS